MDVVEPKNAFSNGFRSSDRQKRVSDEEIIVLQGEALGWRMPIVCEE